jgi:16S rRNA (guanine1207-N2)-methyltransferase
MKAVELLYQTAMNIPASDLVVFNAHAHPLLQQLCGQATSSAIRQHFKPEHDALLRLGLNPDESGHHFDLALICPSKNRQQTQIWMAEAMLQLSENGTLIMACANRHGGKSYATALKKLAGNLTSTAKAKCRIFSARKTADLDTDLTAKWIVDGQAQRCTSHGLISQPGLFSWDRPDTGSQLLLSHLHKPLSGEGADLCCGYGLLAEHLLHTHKQIIKLHLIEADQLALSCAEQNTVSWHDKVETHWLDAATEPLPSKLDWVVCNPPFHTGQDRDIELGQSIVKHACRSLKRGGKLYLVANRKLPYEQILRSELRSIQILAESDGFKIIQGSK